MSNTKIIQYVHRPNRTELGQANTHETYLFVEAKIDLSDIFPMGVDTEVKDIKTGIIYNLKSSGGNGSEFRINQMGPIYRDYSVMPGDEITITHFETDGKNKNVVSVKTFNRVVIIVDGKGVEIINIERLANYLIGDREYSLPVNYQGKNAILKIAFLESKKKRSDSPTETDYYSISFDDASLSKNTYYLNIGDYNELVSGINKSEYNKVVIEEYDDTNVICVKPLISFPLQQIFYGAPGTGKSHTINEITEKQPKENVFRTTFHPDSDYATFVGCYKPTREATSILSLHKLHELYPEFKTKVENRPLHRFITKYSNSFRLLTEKEAESVFDKIETSSTVTAEVPKIMAAIEEIPTTSSISYSFVPQTFTKAYLRAWQTEEPVFLVIEEINRGNCAQIFGDLFQLLDRKNGFSEYPIKADNDLAAYIGEQLSKESRDNILDTVKSGEELILPPNLFIWATMNTSDQSLFPIDSAFKRRWEWKYLPINNHEDKNYKIEIGSIKYDWWGFLSKINQVIGDTTSSEDKKLGYFFAKANEKGIVTAEQFVGKVLFYLWNDVFKNYGFDNQIFDKGDNKKFDFSEFFKQDGSPDTEMVNKFLGKLDETIDKENSFVEKAKDENGQGE